MVSTMDKGRLGGQMDLYTKDSGEIAKKMDLAYSKA